jgi:hypothetical protein
MMIQWDQSDMFIKGRLIENNAGAKYRGLIYDRSLRIVNKSGFDIAIFDDSYPLEPISRHCLIGQEYEFVVMVMIGTQTTIYDSAPAHNGDSSDLTGTLVDPNWFPPDDPELHFHYFSPRLYHNAGGFRMVKTDFGHVLFGPDEIHEAARSGSYVEWAHTRLELLAICQTENNHHKDSAVASYTS